MSDIQAQLGSGSQTVQELAACGEEVTFVSMLVSGPLHRTFRNRLQSGSGRAEYFGRKYGIKVLRHEEGGGRVGEALRTDDLD